jgi:hypothetical protein
MTTSKQLRQPGLLVYLSGVGTSGLVLWLVEIINNLGENIMGWYANGIIPAGALLVGIASGVGYAIAARVLNVKLSKLFVLGMITTGLFDYVAAQWVTYSNVIERNHISPDSYSFLNYIRDICENMSFRSSGSNEKGTPLGAFGYVYKVLEMLGFSFGCMLPCVVLRGMPYCLGCQRYLKRHAVSNLYSPVLAAAIKELPRRERPAAVQAAVDAVSGRALAVLQKVASLSLDETLAALGSASEEPVKKTAASASLRLLKCPQCDGHYITTGVNFIAANGKPGQATLPALDKTGRTTKSEPVQGA